VASIMCREPKLIKAALLAAALVAGCATSMTAQDSRVVKRRQAAPIKPPVVLIPPVQPSAELLQPPRPLTPEQMPPVVPQVSWDGEQLTISAENSTLGAVLDAVRDATGAEIDAPPAATRERVVVHLGPGSAREVLSSLLGGTAYDYLIQAADDNSLGVQSILLTARTKPGGSSADARAAIMAAQPRRRFGSANPAPAENTDSSEDSASAAQAVPVPQESVEPPATIAAQTSAPAEAKSAAPAAEAVAAEAKPANADPAVASSDAVRVQADLTPPAAPATDADGRSLGMREQKVLEMQNLFELRKQMQQQALKGNQSN
jgi:hypothetical protein